MNFAVSMDRVKGKGMGKVKHIPTMHTKRPHAKVSIDSEYEGVVYSIEDKDPEGDFELSQKR